MLLPTGKFLHQDLSTYYARSERLIRDLQEMRFSGFMKVSSWEYEGYLIFDTGKIIQIFVQHGDSFNAGHVVLQSILQHLEQKEGIIDVCMLESEILTVLTSLNTRKLVREMHNIANDDLLDTVGEARSGGELGYIEIDFGKKHSPAAIFFAHGSITASVLQTQDERIVTETKSEKLYERISSLIEKIPASLKTYYCDPIAAYEESVNIQIWVDFYNLKAILDKLLNHIFSLLKFYCKEKITIELLLNALEYLPERYGFNGVTYQDGQMQNFNNNNLDDVKLFYIGIIKDIIEKIEDAYPIDRVGLKVGLLPFMDDNIPILNEYNLLGELKTLFNG
jgi:hypothetical protein